MSVVFVGKKKVRGVVERKIIPANIILDIGCGIKPQSFIQPKIHICIEPHLEYLECLMKKSPHNLRAPMARHSNYVYLNSRGEAATKLFLDKSIDSIFMIDIIEHIEKDDGFELLKQSERIAKNQIIVMTPLGFYPQMHIEGRKDRWGMDGGEFQKHRSGWKIEDFDDSWDLTCVKEFHFDDGYGNVFDKPIGIIWAIKNIKRGE